MDTLQRLREKNPHVAFYSVADPAFRPFGRVIDFDGAALIAAAEKIAMPEAGTKYVPDLPELETEKEFAAVRHALRGEGSCQIGLCWGYNSLLNCLEYHRASEHNIAVTDLVLLLADQREMEGNDLPAGKVIGFFVPKGTVIEVYATTLHFCPCQVGDAGFSSIVILPRGTNHPLTGERPATAEGRLLWAADKWLIAHADNAPVLARGAYPGLHGENFKINY